MNTDFHEVLIVCPTPFGGVFFQDLALQCEEQISSAFHNIRPILRFLRTERGNDASGRLAILIEREKRLSKTGIGALIIAPTGCPELNMQVEHIWRVKRIPAATLSLQIKVNGNGFKPPCVVVRGKSACEQLGKSAGRQMLAAGNAKQFNVILISGDRRRTDSCERLESFENGVRHAFDGHNQKLCFHRTNDCEWQRSLAMKAVTEVLARVSTPSIVAAANDQMALGACDALRYRKVKERTVGVYGFDAIPEVVERIQNSNESYLRGTVGQNTSIMANHLVEFLPQLLDPSKQETMQKDGPTVEVQAYLVEADSDPYSGGATERVPLYRTENHQSWVSAKEAAFLEKADPNTMAQQRIREKSAQGIPLGYDSQGQWGIDKMRRSWRSRPHGVEPNLFPKGTRIIYLRSTLRSTISEHL